MKHKTTRHDRVMGGQGGCGGGQGGRGGPPNNAEKPKEPQPYARGDAYGNPWPGEFSTNYTVTCRQVDWAPHEAEM